jgi:hypothetical protein
MQDWEVIENLAQGVKNKAGLPVFCKTSAGIVYLGQAAEAQDAGVLARNHGIAHTRISLGNVLTTGTRFFFIRP